MCKTRYRGSLQIELSRCAYRFIVRDFTYDESQAAKQAEEYAALQANEKELWNDLLRVSQTNLAEAVELTAHLRVVRAHVECLLRYGLPAAFFFAHIKVRLTLCCRQLKSVVNHLLMPWMQPDPKQIKKLVGQLNTYFKPLCRGYSADKHRQGKSGGGSSSSGGDEMLGEFASVLEAEALDFVLFESPPLTES